MHKQKFITFAVMILTLAVAPGQSLMAFAAEKSVAVTGIVYEFERDSHYEISTATASPDADPLGEFSFTGNVKADGESGGFVSYDVKSENVSFSYTFDKAVLDAPEEKWHLVKDKSKEIDGIELEKNIESGAMILQSSLDGKTWTEDVLMQDIFSEDSELETPFYTTKYIQQQNGCYFRLIVAYEMEVNAGSHKVLFVDVDDKEYKKVAEVYEFYLHDTSSAGIGTISSNEKFREINPVKSTFLEPNKPHFRINGLEFVYDP